MKLSQSTLVRLVFRLAMPVVSIACSLSCLFYFPVSNLFSSASRCDSILFETFSSLLKILKSRDADLHLTIAGELYTVEHGLGVSALLLPKSLIDPTRVGRLMAAISIPRMTTTMASAHSSPRRLPGNMSHVPFILILNLMSSMRLRAVLTGVCSIQRLL